MKHPRMRSHLARPHMCFRAEQIWKLYFIFIFSIKRPTKFMPFLELDKKLHPFKVDIESARLIMRKILQLFS